MTTKAPSTSGGGGRSAPEEGRSSDGKKRHSSSAAAAGNGGGGGGDDERRQRRRRHDSSSGAAAACANAHALRTLDARFSLHLHPSRAGDALAGAREALAAQLLRHSPDLGGVLLAVERERLAPSSDDDDDGGGGGAYGTSNGNGAGPSAAAPCAPLHPYHPYLRVTAAARALVFRLPPRGKPLVGFVTKVGRDYVALLVQGALGAAVGASGIRSDFKFRPASVVVGSGALGALSPGAAGGSLTEGPGEEGTGGAASPSPAAAAALSSPAAAAAAGAVPAAWVSRRDPSHVLTVGTEVRFEVTGSVSASGLYSILGALRQPWTGAVAHVPAPDGNDKEEGDEAERRRRKRHDKGEGGSPSRGKDDKKKEKKEKKEKKREEEKKKKKSK